MAYMDNVAKKKVTDPSGVTGVLKAVDGKEAQYEQFTGDGEKKVPVSAVGKYNVGNVVQMSPNPFGSDTVKNALNTYSRKILPAVQNPDGERSRPTTRTAIKDSNVR